MKYLLSGGGTGGHIYPALAIANEIKSQNKDAEILFVGTNKGLEAELVPKSGYNFKTIRVSGMPRRLNKESFIALRELLHGLSEAKRIIKEYKPDIVIGTGGYVSGPVVFMAKKRGIPVLIHEQNAFPGITNKILGSQADKIAVTFDEARKYFKHPERVVKTGNPIRKQILEVDKSLAYNKLKIKPTKPFILSFGGSGGQKKLNDAFFQIIKNYKDSDDYQLIHVTGSRMYDSFMERIKNEKIVVHENLRVLPYFYDMPEALNIADIIVTSAGAITLAEISAVGVPSILIPKAYTAENHQEYNARVFEENKAAILLLEKDLTPKLLYNNIMNLIKDKDRLKTMGTNSKKLGDIHAARKISDLIEELLKKK
ncbi:undecaprenyldiphospho-muramoylpentapeptide beta-N-acetylglucosaminyltransferase [Tissierella creatinini]|nr:undecaprenyldiphospho-muramoylpentapeptide beta-N-acetylglucosaminyltransferase [Tissierella creatinini]TJX64429.1 undecaprenyldiphospho-muramoylpentapeptide beta-N-acetylglucosaminyltransferase [Soehngenia saccharolytica]